ncbi:MAG: hypothetical protein KUG74_16955 [Rhodobacteraceae bacterium]|nr:hypothetical protein [Paracoccaceae bacterium]
MQIKPPSEQAFAILTVERPEPITGLSSGIVRASDAEAGMAVFEEKRKAEIKDA